MPNQKIPTKLKLENLLKKNLLNTVSQLTGGLESRLHTFPQIQNLSY